MSTLKNAYTYTGEPASLASSYAGTSYATGYTYDGRALPLKNDTAPWDGRKWCFVCDSNWDKANRNAYLDNQLYSDEYVASLLPTSIFYSNDASGLKYAIGGRGMTLNKTHAYYQYNFQSDLDVIIMMMSPNDWHYDTQSTVGARNRFSTTCTSAAGDSNRVGSVTNPADDMFTGIDKEDTIASIINHTIASVHAQAPNAKLIICSGYAFPIDNGFNNKYLRNAVLTTKATVQDWLAKDKLGCTNWLSFVDTFFDCDIAAANYTYSISNERILASNFITDKEPTYTFDSEIVDNENYTYSLDPYKENPTIFAQVPGVTDNLGFQKMYVPHNNSITSGSKWGHFGYLLHQRFYAPVIAHILAKALSPDLTDAQINALLPDSLKYDNV